MIKGSIPVNWRAFPFIRLLFPFIFGILLSEYFDIIEQVWSICFITCLLLTFLFLSFRDKFSSLFHLFIGFIVNVILIVLGIICVQLQNPGNYGSYFGNYINRESNDIIIRVDDFKVQDNWIKVIGNVREIVDSNNQFIKTQGKVLLYLQPGETIPTYGQLIRLKVKVFPVPGIKNPNTFNYKRYLEHQNIYFEGFCKKDKWILIDKYEHTIKTYAGKCMLSMLQLFKRHLGDSDEYAVACALLFGYRNEISYDLNNAYIQTGAVHILAVSGLHVGIISGLISLLLGFIKKNSLGIRIIKLAIIISILWGFVFIAGASGSIIRAAVMFTVIHTGSLLFYRKYLYNSLASAAFLVLLVEPKMIYDVGFQLSYIAVIGIVAIQPLLLKIWAPTNKILVLFWQLYTITIAAQIATLPLILYYFHQTSLYFIIAGLFVVPISTMAMYMGIGLIISNYILPVVAGAFGGLMYLCLHSMNKIIINVHQIPGNLIDNIPFNGLEASLLLSFILILIFSIVNRNKYSLYTSLSILIIFIAYRSFLIIDSRSQQIITFYSSKHLVYIDYFQGQTCYQISQSTTTIQEKYISRDNRINSRINLYEPIAYNDSVSESDIVLENNILRIQNKQYYFLENKSVGSYGIDTSKNVYVLNDINPNDLEPNNSTLLLILNPLMPFKLRNQWKDWAVRYNIGLVDLKLGALTINLSQ